MYSGDFHGREAILIFSTCWKFSVPVIVSEHYDCASGGNSCGMCFQFHFLRFVPYEFRIPDKRIQNNQTNMSHNVTYTYIYIYTYMYTISILLVAKFKFKAKTLQFPDALPIML